VPTAATSRDVTSALWAEWGRITRFLESARLALAREEALWASLEFRHREEIGLVAKTGGGTYKVRLGQHLEAVGDEQTLHASMLVHSYAIAEAAAARKLGVESRALRGIEDWGGRLLRANGRGWESVTGGCAGAVEVAVLRNAFAHGTRTIDEFGERRLAKAGAPVRLAGSPVTLSYAELWTSRGRLRSLLQVSAVETQTVSCPAYD